MKTFWRDPHCIETPLDRLAIPGWGLLVLGTLGLTIVWPWFLYGTLALLVAGLLAVLMAIAGALR